VYNASVGLGGKYVMDQLNSIHGGPGKILAGLMMQGYCPMWLARNKPGERTFVCCFSTEMKVFCDRMETPADKCDRKEKM